jgi:hypothetical protein
MVWQSSTADEYVGTRHPTPPLLQGFDEHSAVELEAINHFS